MYFDFLRQKLHRPHRTISDLAIAPERPAPYDPDRSLVFMHVPKTAGTALINGLLKAHRPRQVVVGFDRALFGGYQNFDAIAPTQREQIYLSPDEIPGGAGFVAGHMAFSSLRDSYPTAQFITVLREPVSRLLSHWLFWRQHEDHELAGWGPWADRVRRARGPLAAFLASGDTACQFDNIAVRMLLWPHALIPADGFIDPRHDERLVAEASAMLDRFDVCDVLESGTIEADLAAWMDLPIVNDWLNETRPPPEEFRTALHHEFTPEASRLLERSTRLDLQLWMTLGRRRLSTADLSVLRHQTLLTNTARFAMIAAGVRPTH